MGRRYAGEVLIAEADPAGLIAAASGIALVLLGLLVLAVRPLRLPAIAFSAFAVLWGVSVVAANMVFRLAPVHSMEAWAMVMVATTIPLYLPLLFFAFNHPWRPDSFAGRLGLWSAAGSPILLFVMLLIAEPALFVRFAGLNEEGHRVLEPGLLYWPIVLWNTVFAVLLALVVVARRLMISTAAGVRDQLALGTAALMVYVSYLGAVPFHIVFLPLDDWFVAGSFLARAIAGGLALVLAATIIVWAAKTKDIPWRDVLLASASVPLAVGVAEVVLRALGVEWINTIGFWRFAMVGLFAYTVARHNMFDAELRLSRIAGPTSYGVVLVVAMTLAWTIFVDPFVAMPMLGVAVSLGIAATAVPVYRVTHRLAQRSAPNREPDYLYRRKLDVYRGALEEAQAHRFDSADEEVFLSRLRRRLRISPDEHRVLLTVLESTRASRRAGGSGIGTRFHVERELGRGSFGRALLARDLVLDRPVVLKQALHAIMDDDAMRTRFLKEARVMARIHHPNIVAVHEVLDEETTTLVMEYLPGGNLRERLQQRAPLPFDSAIALTRDVLAALDGLHRAGIIHRDLKPENILLAEDGTAKVSDFGVARTQDVPADSAFRTEVGVQPGTLAYMSPEQVRGDEVTFASDIYSVGLLLYEMLTGSLPYRALNGGTAAGSTTQAVPERFDATALRHEVQNENLELAHRGIPSPLERVIRMALAKEPASRFPDASAMRDALAGLQDG